MESIYSKKEKNRSFKVEHEKNWILLTGMHCTSTIKEKSTGSSVVVLFLIWTYSFDFVQPLRWTKEICSQKNISFLCEVEI